MNITSKNWLGIAITVVALVSLSGLAYAAANQDQAANLQSSQQITNQKADSKQSISQNIPINPNSRRISSRGGVKFYTDKTTYKYGSQILLILENDGSRTIWVPNIFESKWQIVNQKTHEIIYLPLEDCNYGNCGDDFTRLEFGDKITQTWDQFNNDDEHVPAGTYIASATYRLNNPSTMSVYKVYTKTFKIKKP